MNIANLSTTQARDANGNSTRWASRADAEARSLKYKPTYNAAVHARVDAMMDKLASVYHNKGVFHKYGALGVSVKVNRPTVANPDALREIELAWQELAVYKKVSPQGVIYRFDR